MLIAFIALLELIICVIPLKLSINERNRLKHEAIKTGKLGFFKSSFGDTDFNLLCRTISRFIRKFFIKTSMSKRNWKEYNEKLIKRGELLLDLMLILKIS